MEQSRSSGRFLAPRNKQPKTKPPDRKAGGFSLPKYQAAGIVRVHVEMVTV